MDTIFNTLKRTTNEYCLITKNNFIAINIIPNYSYKNSFYSFYNSATNDPIFGSLPKSFRLTFQIADSSQLCLLLYGLKNTVPTFAHNKVKLYNSSKTWLSRAKIRLKKSLED